MTEIPNFEWIAHGSDVSKAKAKYHAERAQQERRSELRWTIIKIIAGFALAAGFGFALIEFVSYLPKTVAEMSGLHLFVIVLVAVMLGRLTAQK